MKGRVQRGTTLVEVMAAVLILALTVSAAGAMFPLGAFMRDRSGGHSRAASIIQRKLEQVRRFPANSLTYKNLIAAGLVDDTDDVPATFTKVDNVPTDLNHGLGILELTGVGTNVVQIKVTLRWQNTRGGTLEVSAVTRVVNKEVWVKS